MTNNSLVDIKTRLAAELARVRKETPATSGHKISLKGKIFTFPDGQQSRNPIDCVILDWRIFNQYFKGVYNPAKIEPPTCFAIGPSLEGLKPSDKSTTKQGELCATCSMNQFGTAPTGRGKACKNGRRLAVVPADATLDSNIYTIDVSPTGIKALDGYVSKLAAALNLLPIQLVTTLSMNPNESYPTLMFSPAKPLDDERLHIMFQLRDAAQPILDAEPDIRPAA